MASDDYIFTMNYSPLGAREVIGKIGKRKYYGMTKAVAREQYIRECILRGKDY